MEQSQRNVFGNNVVNNYVFSYLPDRQLTTELANELVTKLDGMGVDSVAIHYEADGETTEFANRIAAFLSSRFTVTGVGHLMSGYQRNTIVLEPADDPKWAYLRIGTL